MDDPLVAHDRGAGVYPEGRRRPLGISPPPPQRCQIKLPHLHPTPGRYYTSVRSECHISRLCLTHMTHLSVEYCVLTAANACWSRELMLHGQDVTPNMQRCRQHCAKRGRPSGMLFGGGLLLFPRMACAIVPARATCAGHERGNQWYQLAKLLLLGTDGSPTNAKARKRLGNIIESMTFDPLCSPAVKCSIDAAISSTPMLGRECGRHGDEPEEAPRGCRSPRGGCRRRR